MGKLSRWLGRKTGTPSARQISLLDLESGDRVVDWWAVFYPRTPHFWFAHLMKQGFRHVELMRPHYYGPLATDVMWLVLRPNFEILENHIEFDPTPPRFKLNGLLTDDNQFAYYKDLRFIVSVMRQDFPEVKLFTTTRNFISDFLDVKAL